MKDARRAGALAILGLLAPAARAHGGAPRSWGELWLAWPLDPLVLVALGLSAGLYALGFRRLAAASQSGRRVRVREAWCFLGGWLALAVALASPLHSWGRALFSAHMTQHEVLMLVAAPLLVLGRPQLPFVWALPAAWRRLLSAGLRAPALRGGWTLLAAPMTAWAIHGAILWLWHLPPFFEASIVSEVAHTMQHASFLGSAVLFWWAILRGRKGARRFGAGVLFLFTTALHSGLLGAMLTFAPAAWYPSYGVSTPFWGMTALEDQQLGGLIMWIPAGLVYVGAALLMLAAWLREADRHVERREAAADSRAAQARPKHALQADG